MTEAVPEILREWETYYVILGAAAGALAGLQFVVLTLITESGALQGTGDTLSAFGSPTVVHFCAALGIAGLVTAPWHGLGSAGGAITLAGGVGLAYSLRVLGRALRQRDYRIVLEDWIWHIVLPVLAHAALLVAGSQLAHAPFQALFAVGGVALLLIFIGIHNAWDTVAYVLLERTTRQASAAPRPASPAVPDATEPGPGAP